MKALWLFAAAVVVAFAPVHAGEKEKELCDDANGMLICEIPNSPPDSVIKALPKLTDPPDHMFFRAEI